MTTSLDRTAERLVKRALRRTWSARHALTWCALVAAAHGVALTAAPGVALQAFGASHAGDATYWLRSSGVLFLAVAMAFRTGARWPSSMMQRPVLVAAFMLTAALTVTGIVAMLDGVIGPRFGIVVGTHALLAIWTGWLLITDRI